VPGSINQWNTLCKFAFDNGTDLVLNLDIARDLRSRRQASEHSGTNLFEANLRGANLSGANLSGEDLFAVNLIQADLSGASSMT